MRRIRRRNTKIRQISGLILALGGALLVIQTVPLTAWYIILGVLFLCFLLLLFMK